MHITNESNSGVKNLETESCTSDVTCALEQTGLRGDGEQSSTCSQVLDGTTAELQSTIVVDMTTTKHKCIAIDQQTSISASYQPQTSSDTECIQLAIDLDSNLNLYQKKSSCQPHRNNFSITTPVYFEFPQFKK